MSDCTAVPPGRSESPGQTTVGPRPRCSTSVPQGHRAAAGGKSHSSAHLVPKKERLRAGRQRDKQRLQALRAQLDSAWDQLANATSGTADPGDLVSRAAAIRAATAAATHSALQQDATLEQAMATSTAVADALKDLAVVPLPACTSALSSDAEKSSADEAGLYALHKGSMVERFDIFDADDTAWRTAGKDGCSAALAVSHPGTVAPAMHSSADAAAGAYAVKTDSAHSELPGAEAMASAAPAANSLECASPAHLPHTVAANTATGLECAPCHPEHHPSSVLFFGGRTSVKTLTVADQGACGHDQSGTLPSGTADAPAHASPRAFDAISRDVQLDFNSQHLANTAVLFDDKCGPLPTAVMRIPCSSSPGSQDDAHDIFYNSVVLENTTVGSESSAGNGVDSSNVPLPFSLGLCRSSVAQCADTRHVKPDLGEGLNLDSQHLANTAVLFDAKECGLLSTAVMRIPGSSSPGSQIDAHDISYNDYKNIVVGDNTVGTEAVASEAPDCRNTAEIANDSTDSGIYYPGVDDDPVSIPSADGDAVGHVEKLQDFNSQTLASSCCSDVNSQDCGPLPLHASPRAFEANSQKDFTSQHAGAAQQTLPLAFVEVATNIIDVYLKRRKPTRSHIESVASAFESLSRMHGVPRDLCQQFVNGRSSALSVALDDYWRPP